MSRINAPFTIEQQLDIARKLLPDLAPYIDEHVVPRLQRQTRTQPHTWGSALARMDEAKAHQAEATRRDRAYVFLRVFRARPELAATPLACSTPEVFFSDKVSGCSGRVTHESKQCPSDSSETVF